MTVTTMTCQVDDFPSFTADILLDDATDGAPHKEGHSVKILVTINKGYGRAKVSSLPKGQDAELQLRQVLQDCSSTYSSIFSQEMKGSILKIAAALFCIIHAQYDYQSP